jgi:hypothetical protein
VCRDNCKNLPPCNFVYCNWHEFLVFVCVVCCLQPLLRNALDKNPEMNLNEALEVVHQCMTVLYYRDARSWDLVSNNVLSVNAGSIASLKLLRVK